MSSSSQKIDQSSVLVIWHLGIRPSVPRHFAISCQWCWSPDLIFGLQRGVGTKSDRCNIKYCAAPCFFFLCICNATCTHCSTVLYTLQTETRAGDGPCDAVVMWRCSGVFVFVSLGTPPLLSLLSSSVLYLIISPEVFSVSPSPSILHLKQPVLAYNHSTESS